MRRCARRVSQVLESLTSEVIDAAYADFYLGVQPVADRPHP
jgi:hypothetical protein